MTLDIEQIKRDRQAGTPGPWREKPLAYCCVEAVAVKFAVASAGVASDNTRDLVPEQEANARRIARVPDLEAAVIAQAEEIKRLRKENTAPRVRLLQWDDFGCSPMLGRHYSVIRRGEVYQARLTAPMFDVIGDYQTPEAAKSACQLDFERFVSPALRDEEEK